MDIVKFLRLRRTTDIDKLRDKAADRIEWQCLVEKLGGATDDVDDSNESINCGSRGITNSKGVLHVIYIKSM